MLDHLTTYDAIYALAAAGEREDRLFGGCAPLAREAFRRSLIGDEFPLVWFEIPLLGEPRFDVHVALSRKALRSGAHFLPGAGNGYDELFSWYSESEEGGGGLAFAYDVSEGSIDAPAVHANVNRAPLNDMGRFFELAGGKDAAEAHEIAKSRVPSGWSEWYAGVHPGRPGSHVRVDYFVSNDLKSAYVSDFARFERDLEAFGFSATGEALRKLAAPVLESPFGLELQFDVMRDGALGATLGLSAAFKLCSATRVRELWSEGGATFELMGAIERMGLADTRWHDVAGASFSKLVTVGGGTVALYCVPTFVKLRLRDGEPLDAKVYLQAGMFEQA